MAGTQDEHAGLVGFAKDALGLGYRGQMEYMQWSLFHMPSTWRQRSGGFIGGRWGDNYGFRWRGPIAGSMAARPLEWSYNKLTGRGRRIPFLSSFLRGTGGRYTGEIVSPINLESARRSFGADILRTMGELPEQSREFVSREFAQFQRAAAAKGRQTFSESLGRKRYGRAAQELFTGARGEAFVSRYYYGGTASPEAIAAGRGLYRSTAARTLLQGAGKIMYPLTITLNAAMAVDIGITLGTAAGRAVSGLANRMSQFDTLDFGSGVFAASTFGASITERKRALQAIQRNNLNARRVIGAEATMLHS